MITKNAEFLEGFAETILNKYGPEAWMKKPFETIFSAIIPAIGFRINWILGILLYVGEYAGYGPGLIGSLVDKHLGIGKGPLDLSDENLQSAASKAVGELAEKTQSMETTSADMFLRDVRQVKGTLIKEDLVSAFYISKMYKTAKGDRSRLISRFFGQGTIGITSLLYTVLKMF